MTATTAAQGLDEAPKISDLPYKVVMLGRYNEELDHEFQVFGCHVDVLMPNSQNKYDISTLAKYNGAVMWHDGSLCKDDLDTLKKLNPQFSAIVRIGAGFDNVDIQHAAKLGISVSNVPDYGTEEVADSAMCLLLMLCRRYYKNACELQFHNKYLMSSDMKGARRLHGLQCGIIGLGNIGKCFAMRAKAFGLHVVFYDPYVPHGTDKALSIKRVHSLQELLEKSDIVSIHCWLSEETKYLINSKNMKSMKKGSFLINTARGAIVEEAAVVEALTSGQLAGAGLDVLEKEPYTDGHLKDVPNLIVTPHCAFYSDESFVEIRTKAAQELKRLLDGVPAWYSVNKQFM